MSSSTLETSETISHPEPGTADRQGATWVFFEWCVRQEAFSNWMYCASLMLLFFAGFDSLIVSPSRWPPQPGSALLTELFWGSAWFILIGGILHASQAVCWEVSREQRDLVRLTAIDPILLLWSKSLCRWWTIGLSILVILPLAMFARTMGAVSVNQWFAGMCGLLLTFVLTAGFAMIASVASSQSSNAELTAGMATTLLIVLYHVFYCGCALVIVTLNWFVSGTFQLPPGSMADQAFGYILTFAPAAEVYKAIYSPVIFSPLDPAYWLHFLVAAFCLRSSSVVMRNRFRVTTRGDVDEPQEADLRQLKRSDAPLRPRCTDRPFFWKDVYILNDGELAQSRWIGKSFLLLMGVIYSMVYLSPLVTGIVAIIVASCIVAVRFDALLVAEFREKTWSSLMLLPINPREPLIAKIYAAAWEQRGIILPVGIAAVGGLFADAGAIFMASTISALIGVLLVQISTVNQLNIKVWWVNPVIGVFAIFLMGIEIIVWGTLNPVASFVITVLMLAIMTICLNRGIDLRLKSWSE